MLAWPLEVAGKIFNEDNSSIPLAYEVTINADGPFGRLEPLTYTIDLTDIARNHAVPPGTLHGVTRALEAIEKSLTKSRTRP